MPPKGKGSSKSRKPKASQSQKDAERSGDSQTESEKGSAADATPLVGDPGPQFDPESAAEPPAPEEAEPSRPNLQVIDGDPVWEPDGVLREILGLQGEALHLAIGVGEADWDYTERDLDAIAPPLSRILNRYDFTRQFAAFGDPAALTIALFRVAVRSLNERKEALEGEGGDEPEPPEADENGEVPRSGPPEAPPPGVRPVSAEPPPAARVAQGQVDPHQVDWKLER